MRFAQIPDPSSVMETANETGSWVVVLLVFLVLAMVGGFVMLFKMLRDTYQQQVMHLIEDADERLKDASEREKRLSDRINQLEKEHFNKISALLERQLELTAKTESTLHSFSTGQNEINGDLKRLCILLSTSPCLVMAKGQGKYKIVDEAGNEVHYKDL